LLLRIATYNVHKCRGLDGRTHPGRIASVLKTLNPDLVALQEVVGAGPRGKGQEEELASRMGMEGVLAPARILRGHLYGNAVLSRLPIHHHRTYDLTRKGHEPRFCQRVDVILRGHRIQIFNVHLGTAVKERNWQAEKLLACLSDPAARGPKVIVGDFNEWKKGPATRLLAENFQSLDLRPFLKWRRTYPGMFPIFHLDHIYYDGPIEIMHAEVPRTLSSLLASDHMPLVADLHLRLRG